VTVTILGRKARSPSLYQTQPVDTLLTDRYPASSTEGRVKTMVSTIVEPNQFDLTGPDETVIVYSMTGFGGGQPQFHYEDKKREVDFMAKKLVRWKARLVRSSQ
jgi:hypothetical protein